MRTKQLLCLLTAMLSFLGAFGFGGPAVAQGDHETGTLVIGTSYSPPLSSPDQQGFFDKLLSEAGKRLGLEVQMRMLPAARSLHDADAGLIDGDVGRVKAIAALYPGLRRVEYPVLRNRDFVAFARGQRFETSSWEALAPYSVGYVRGWKIFGQNATTARMLLAVDSTETLFSMLKAGRIQVALNARLDGLAMARELGVDDVEVMSPPLASMEMFLYLNERHEALCRPFAEALQQMVDDGTVQHLTQSMEKRYLKN